MALQNVTGGREGCPFRIILNGRAYGATYSIRGPMLVVETLLMGVKRRQLGDEDPEVMARGLLSELVYGYETPRSA
ncbi:MAG: hypothetical protein ABI533_02610 [Betaproteobacteria bacterium]